MAETKAFYKSRTFWAGLVAVGASFLTQLDSVLSTEATVTVMALLMMGMRAVTKSGVTLK